MAGPYCRDGDKQIRSGDKVFRFRGYQLSQPALDMAGAYCMHWPCQICSLERRWSHFVAILDVKGDALS